MATVTITNIDHIKGLVVLYSARNVPIISYIQYPYTVVS